MQIVTDLQRNKTRFSKPIILALGNFDGFHRGHQRLLDYVLQQAKRHHALSAVMTFREHPHHILHPHQKPLLLYSVEQKLFYLAQTGIDLCFLPSFTPVFSQMTPEQFVKNILVQKLHILEICMGQDARFGHARKGDTRLMERFAKDYGFWFKKMGPVKTGKKIISSSRVRELLMKGKIEEVGKCLARPFSLFGKVVHGKGHGTHLGFPTANLEVHSDILLPLGVYVASGRLLPKATVTKSDCHQYSVTRCAGPWLPGVMNFGKRPTYPKAETPRPVLELHLFNFDKKIYGRMVEIALHKFLRPEKKFPTEEALRKAIQADIQAAQQYPLKNDTALDKSGGDRVYFTNPNHRENDVNQRLTRS